MPLNHCSLFMFDWWTKPMIIVCVIFFFFMLGFLGTFYHNAPCFSVNISFAFLEAHYVNMPHGVCFFYTSKEMEHTFLHQISPPPVNTLYFKRTQIHHLPLRIHKVKRATTVTHAQWNAHHVIWPCICSDNLCASPGCSVIRNNLLLVPWYPYCFTPLTFLIWEGKQHMMFFFRKALCSSCEYYDVIGLL